MIVLYCNVIMLLFISLPFFSFSFFLQREERKESSKRSSTNDRSGDHSKDQNRNNSTSSDAGNRVLISQLPPNMSERKLKQMMQSVGDVEVWLKKSYLFTLHLFKCILTIEFQLNMINPFLKLLFSLCIYGNCTKMPDSKTY